jgi:drug/metabolite transporter (DMT)-like permease
MKLENINDLSSVNTELLSDELKLEKRRKEKIAYIYGIISQFLWAIVSIQIKTMITLFPNDYTINTIAFYRTILLAVIGYYLCKKKNIKIHRWNEIQHKFWFLVRNVGFYAMVVLWVVMNIYFRVSTCQCISNCHPVLVIVISSFLLNEKFYPRYIIGIILCFIGAYMIVSNERKSTNINEDKDSNIRNLLDLTLRYLEEQSNGILFGAIAAVSHLTICAFANFAQRELAKENILGDEQNFWLGVYNCFFSFIVMVFQGNFGLSNIKYPLYVLTNGPIFYFANYFTAEALKYISINKLIPLNYLTIVFVFILGYIFLGEKVYFTDLLGAIIIVGFQLYNIYVPTTK